MITDTPATPSATPGTFTFGDTPETNVYVPPATTPVQTVTIPACAEHEGIYARTVTLVWRCPVCGRLRGNVEAVASYDGSRRLFVDGWTNPCGHVDKYSAVREEANQRAELTPDSTFEPAKDTKPMITIIDQRQSAACTKAFRVELRDAHGLVIGCGYGQSPESAFADARDEYQENRERETRMTLRDADREFLRERRGLKTSAETR